MHLIIFIFFPTSDPVVTHTILSNVSFTPFRRQSIPVGSKKIHRLDSTKTQLFLEPVTMVGRPLIPPLFIPLANRKIFFPNFSISRAYSSFLFFLSFLVFLLYSTPKDAISSRPFFPFLRRPKLLGSLILPLACTSESVKARFSFAHSRTRQR